MKVDVWPLCLGFDCTLRKTVKWMWKRGRSWPGRRCWSLSQKKNLKSASTTSTPQRKVGLLSSLNDGFRRVQRANSVGDCLSHQVSVSPSDRRGIMRWHGKSCWRRRRSHSETSWTICTPETHPVLSAIMNTIWRWVYIYISTGHLVAVPLTDELMNCDTFAGQMWSEELAR